MAILLDVVLGDACAVRQAEFSLNPTLRARGQASIESVLRA